MINKFLQSFINNKWLVSLVILILVFAGCTKGPGEGGRSTIKGKVYAYNYNTLGVLVSEGFAPEVHVYLVFGDDGFYSLDTKTGYDGTYEFPYLKKGQYTVYAYSKCTTCTLGTEPIFQKVDVTANKSIALADTLIINQ